MTNKEFNESFRQRTKQFAVAVIKFCEEIEKKPSTGIVQYQLLKAVTSVAANFRAATRGRSKAEFYAKMCIVVEEADETQFWLELLDEAALASRDKISILYKEATEILAIVTSIRKNVRQ